MNQKQILKQFLGWWFQDVEHSPILWECTPKQIGSGRIRTLKEIPFIALESSELYFRTTTVEEVPKSGRGGASLPGEIPGFWLDVDFIEGKAKSNRYPPRDRLDDLLHDLPEWSGMVETGGGVHLYWKFDNPISTLDNIEMLDCWHNKCAAIWEQQGYLLDKVKTPDRLMRAPGSINFKQNRFATTFEFNDNIYDPEMLIADCESVPISDVTDNYAREPNMVTAYNKVIDVHKVWTGLGYIPVGRTVDPDSTTYLRPGSEASKSLNVWDNSNVTTIHSTTTVDDLGLEKSSLSPYTLCKNLGSLKEWEKPAEEKLVELKSEFYDVVKRAEAGQDTSSEMWHEAAQMKILERRFANLRADKHDLVRPYPKQLLPELLVEASDELAEAVNAPPEMAYTLALGAVSVAVAGAMKVRIFDTPVALFVLVAAPPSSGKSPVLRKLVRYMKEDDSKRLKSWLPMRKAYKEQLEKVENQIAKHAETNDPQSLEQLKERHEMLVKLCEPPDRIWGKMTPAALLHKLSKKDSASVVSGEAADWIMSFRDSNTGEINGDALLDIYDGTDTKKDTLSNPGLVVECGFAMLLCIQSENLGKFSNLQESGFWQRFLYVDLPDKLIVKRGVLEAEDLSPVLKRFNEMTRSISDKAMNYYAGSVIDYDEEAGVKFLDWQAQTQRRGNEKHPDVFDERYGDNYLYQAISKAHSHAIRIAGLLAVIRCEIEGYGQKPHITVEDMTAGIGLSDWYYDRRVADSLTEIDGIEDAKRKDLFQMLDIHGSVTPTILGRESSYFKRDAKSNKAWLEKIVEEGLIESHPRSQYRRPS